MRLKLPRLKNLGIRTKLIFLVISAILLIMLVQIGIVSPRVDRMIFRKMVQEEMEFELEEETSSYHKIHSKIKDELVIAANNSLFEKYFSLEVTRQGNKYDKQGIIQFTPEQQILRKEIGAWLKIFQKHFNIDEICLIDRKGQEHFRMVFKKVAPQRELSSTEKGAPFFKASFTKGKNGVHIEAPYMSADSKRWVFAYTTPIVLKDGSKPAFLHFEMPLKIFQERLTEEFRDSKVRLFIIDKKGFLMADSSREINLNLRQSGVETEGEAAVIKEESYFPAAVTSNSPSKYAQIIKRMKEGREGITTYNRDGRKRFLAYQPISDFGWSMGIELPSGVPSIFSPDLPQRINRIRVQGYIINLFLVIAGILIALWFSATFTKPLEELSRVALKIGEGDLTEKVEVQSKDEIGVLSRAIKNMLINLANLAREIKTVSLRVGKASSQILTPYDRHNLDFLESKGERFEPGTTMEEIDRTARIIAEHVDMVTKLAEETLVLVQKGQEAVGESTKAMEEIEIKAEDSATQVFSLDEKSRAIGKVLEMVDDVAEQTKVLAVNAAIESARAGEAGKGFTVVAQEIGRLNEQVTEATSEIRKIITEVQDTTTTAVASTKEEKEKVKEGSARSQQAGKVLQNILEAAGKTATSARQISISSHQQKSATQRIVSAMKEIVELIEKLKEMTTKFKTEL